MKTFTFFISFVLLTIFNAGRSDAQTPSPLDVVATEGSPSGGHYAYNDYIVNVTFAGINNTSGPDGWHVDYGRTTPAVAPGVVTPGQTYPISITVNGDDLSFQYVGVYFDWNQDNDLGTSGVPTIDTGEQGIVWNAYSGTGNKTLTGTITVPVTASPGYIYMRVMLDADSPGGSGDYQCYIGYGEFEDYVIQVTSPNNAPTVTGAPSSVTSDEDIASNIDLSSTTFADADGDALTVSIAASAGTLAATSGGSVTIGGSGTGTLTLAGTAANINTYLDTPSNIKYTGASNANGTAVATLTITPNDGIQDGTPATVNIDITAVNDNPTATGLPASVTETEDIAGNLDLSSITLSDVDAGSGNITLTISAQTGTMAMAAAAGLSFSGNASGTIKITGTISNLNIYLSIPFNILYTGASNVNGTAADVLTIKLNDNGNTGTGGGSDITLGTININITAVNDPPIITTSGGTTSFIEGNNVASTPVVIDSGITVTDVDDNTLLSATVAIIGNLHNTEDALTFTNDGSTMGNIAAIYNSFNGILTMTSSGATATLAEWQAAFRAVIFKNISDTPNSSNRTVSFTANDGSVDSNTGTKTVSVTAVNDDPTAWEIPTTVSETEDIAGDLDLSSMTLSDTDAGTGNVTLTISAASGTMTMANAIGLAFGGNATGKIIIAGPISYINSYLSTPTNILYTGAPNVNGTAADVLTIMLNDNGNTGTGGGTDVTLGTVNVNIAAVNDPPVVVGVFGDNSSKVTAGAGAQNLTGLDDATVTNVDSPDYNGGSLIIDPHTYIKDDSFSVNGTSVTSGGDGTIAKNETIAVGGVPIGIVTQFKDTLTTGYELLITFNTADATNARIQALIRALAYSAPTGIGARTFTLTLNDGDGTANGGVQTASGNFAISVIPPVPDIALKAGGNYVNIGDTIFFGDVNIGAQSDTTIYILNEGNADLSIYITTISGDLTHFLWNLSGMNSTIFPLDSTSFKYSFKPTALGNKLINVVLFSNDPDESNYSFFLKGNGIDNVPPVTVCQDLTIALDQNGDASITAAQIDGGSTDNDAIDTMYLDRYDFSAADFGMTIPVELTVVDKSGNTSTCTSQVTISDGIAPKLITHKIKVYLGADGQHMLTDAEKQALTSGTTDNITAPEDIQFSFNPSGFRCYNIGDNQKIQVIATDESGNETRSWALANVMDTFGLHLATSVEDMEVTVGAGECGTTITYPDMTPSNKCTEVKQLEGLGPDGMFPIGTTTEKWLLTNPYTGDSLVVSFNVTVTSDNLPPTIDMVSDVNLFSHASGIEIPLTGISDGGDCQPQDLMVTATHTNPYLVDSIGVDYTSADSSGMVSLYFVPNMSGTDTVTVKVTDSEGGETMQTFTVGVDMENDPPTLNPVEDVMTYEDTTAIEVPLTGITDGDVLRNQDLTVMTDHTNAELITGIMVDYTSPNETGMLTLMIAPDMNGTDTITVTIEDSEGATTKDTFVVTVIPVNDPPYLVNPIPDQKVNASYPWDITLSSVLGEIFNDIDDTMLNLDILLEDGSDLPGWIKTEVTGTEYKLTGIPTLADTGCVNILVQAFDKDGAMATDTFTLCVEGYPVSVQDIGAGEFEVTMYPNPTRGAVNIDMNSNNIGEVQLSVMDITGRVILQKHFSATGTMKFDMSDKVSGMYIVHIDFEGTHIIKKLLVDRR